MKLEKITYYLLLLLIFLIPLQTRWMYKIGSIAGGYWEYGTFSLYGTEILLWFIIVLFAISKFINKKFWHTITNKQDAKKRAKYLIVPIIFLLFNILMIVKSLNPDISSQHFNRLLGAICIATIIVYYCQKHSARFKMLLVFWFSALFQSILAIWQFLIQRVYGCKWFGMASQDPTNPGVGVIEYIDERWLRAYGSLTGPNPLGAYLAVSFVLGIVLYVYLKNRKHKASLLTGQLVILIGLIISFSRAAWLAVVTGMIIFFVIIFLKRKKFKEIFGLALQQYVAYVFLVLLAIIAMAPLFVARFTFSNQLEYVSITERKTQVQQSTQVIENNLILGSGAGTYTQAMYYQNSNLYPWSYQPVHNMYLLMVAEVGLFISFVIFMIYIWIVKNTFCKNKIYLPVLATLFVVVFFEHWTWSLFSGTIFFWTILAFSFNSRMKEKTKTPK